MFLPKSVCIGGRCPPQWVGTPPTGNPGSATGLYASMGLKSPIDKEVSNLVVGLIKFGTVRPMEILKVMPMEPIKELFMIALENAKLSVMDLRMKAITLLAVTTMLRPSDIVPRSVIVTEHGIQNVMFTRNQVTFQEDGSTAISFILGKVSGFL